MSCWLLVGGTLTKPVDESGSREYCVSSFGVGVWKAGAGEFAGCALLGPEGPCWSAAFGWWVGLVSCGLIFVSGCGLVRGWVPSVF